MTRSLPVREQGSQARPVNISNWMSLPRPRRTIEQMTGYTPGEQPKPGDSIVKLNTNENPYPPSPRVIEAIRRIGADALRRYPSPMAEQFRSVAARVHGVPHDCVIAGNG